MPTISISRVPAGLCTRTTSPSRPLNKALARGETLPDRATGAALFADISGFTPLTGALAQELGLERGAKKVKSLRDRVLLVVEMVAVLGLFAIIVGSLLNLQTLNQEVAQARASLNVARASLAEAASTAASKKLFIGYS